MALSKEEALKLAKERGLVASDYKPTPPSRAEAFKIAMERGLVKPRDDGAGFAVRTKFSFADTNQGKQQVLEEEYGKGNAINLGDKWIIKDKKGWNYVDADGFSWQELGKDIFADMTGDLPEMAGASFGAIGGAGWGSIPLAAAGGAAGDGVKKIIAKAIGINDNQTTGEIVSDLGESGLWSGVGQGVGNVLVKGINKGLAPFKSKMTADAVARRDLAKKYGVELTPAQTTQSRTLGQLENVLHNKLWSSDDLAKFADEKQLSPFSNAVNNITPNKSADTIGNEIVSSINGTKQANKNMFEDEYSTLASNINKEIEIPSLIAKAQEIIEANKHLPDSLKDDAVKVANQILEMPTDKIDYNTLSKLRTNLGDKARSGAVTGDIGSAQYKRLKGSLDSDFDTFATYNGVGGQKKEVDAAYRTFKNTYDNNVVKNIVGTERKEAMPTEKIVDSVVNPKEVSRLNKVITASNNKPIVKDAVLNKVINDSKVADFSNPLYGSEFVSPTRYATQADKFGEHLSKVGANEAREIGKVAESIKFSDAFANHSNTAPTLMNSSVLGMLNPVNLGGKVYTSKGGRKWLTDGLKQMNPQTSGFGAVMGASLNND